MISWLLPYLARDSMPDLNNGPGNDFDSDVSKQIRLCTGSDAPARTKHSCSVISLDMLTSLGQTLWMDTSKKIFYGEKKNKVKKGQLANLASLGSLASNQNNACDASLGEK